MRKDLPTKTFLTECAVWPGKKKPGYPLDKPVTLAGYDPVQKNMGELAFRSALRRTESGPQSLSLYRSAFSLANLTSLSDYLPVFVSGNSSSLCGLDPGRSRCQHILRRPNIFSRGLFFTYCPFFARLILMSRPSKSKAKQLQRDQALRLNGKARYLPW
jgi:hypothetical protein